MACEFCTVCVSVVFVCRWIVIMSLLIVLFVSMAVKNARFVNIYWCSC